MLKRSSLRGRPFNIGTQRKRFSGHWTPLYIPLLKTIWFYICWCSLKYTSTHFIRKSFCVNVGRLYLWPLAFLQNCSHQRTQIGCVCLCGAFTFFSCIVQISSDPYLYVDTCVNGKTNILRIKDYMKTWIHQRFLLCVLAMQ